MHKSIAAALLRGAGTKRGGEMRDDLGAATRPPTPSSDREPAMTPDQSAVEIALDSIVGKRGDLDDLRRLIAEWEARAVRGLRPECGHLAEAVEELAAALHDAIADRVPELRAAADLDALAADPAARAAAAAEDRRDERASAKETA